MSGLAVSERAFVACVAVSQKLHSFYCLRQLPRAPPLPHTSARSAVAGLARDAALHSPQRTVLCMGDAGILHIIGSAERPLSPLCCPGRFRNGPICACPSPKAVACRALESVSQADERGERPDAPARDYLRAAYALYVLLAGHVRAQSARRVRWRSSRRPRSTLARARREPGHGTPAQTHCKAAQQHV